MLSKNQVAEIRALHQKKQRELQHQFLAEGVKTVLEILQFRPELIRCVYCTKKFEEQNIAVFKRTRIRFVLISDPELERISLLEKPNEVLAVCNNLPEPDMKFNLTQQTSLYLDGIRDPGNFGTLLRLADWFGIHKLFCSKDSCELYNPKVIQASMGAFLRVDIKYTSLQEVLSINACNKVYGALLSGNDLYDEKLEPGLILIGNEANGISKENLNFVQQALTIPAAASNRTESLNAAMAAGIICSEFYRQLNFKKNQVNL